MSIELQNKLALGYDERLDIMNSLIDAVQDNSQKEESGSQSQKVQYIFFTNSCKFSSLFLEYESIVLTQFVFILFL